MVIKFWLAVNKNGFIGMYCTEPTRNKEAGVWESKRVYLNSVVYPQICQMVKNVKMTWDNEPEVFEIKIGGGLNTNL